MCRIFEGKNVTKVSDEKVRTQHGSIQCGRKEEIAMRKRPSHQKYKTCFKLGCHFLALAPWLSALTYTCSQMFIYLFYFLMLLPSMVDLFIYCCSNIIFQMYWFVYSTDDFVTTRYNFLSMSFLAWRWPFNRLRNKPNHSRNHSWSAFLASIWEYNN